MTFVDEVVEHTAWSTFWMVVDLIGAGGMIGLALSKIDGWTGFYALAAVFLLGVALSDGRRVLIEHDAHRR